MARLDRDLATEITLKALSKAQIKVNRARRVVSSSEEEEEQPQAEVARDEENDLIISVYGFDKDDSLEKLTFRDTNRGEYLKQERMIVGIAQSAVEGRNRETKEQCTVFGFAANSNINPQEFVGGFRYDKDTEKAAAAKAIIAHVIKQYEASHQGQHPSEVVIYWNGQTKGEMSTMLGEIIHEGLQQVFVQLPRAPQWTFMAIERQDNTHIFKTDVSPEDCPSKQNTPTGVVVDSQLTGPAKQQFFLNSPTTFQGSVATLCYTVFYDELNLSMDALETMTFDLAHLHQICSMTTSLPAPLDVATEYAKRGVCLLQEKVEMNDDAPEDELAISHADTVMADRHVNA